MSLGVLCPNLTKLFQKEVSQIANDKLPIATTIGGLSVNLNHLKTVRTRIARPHWLGKDLKRNVDKIKGILPIDILSSCRCLRQTCVAVISLHLP